MTGTSSGGRSPFPPDDRWARRVVWGVWAAMMLVILISFVRNARDIPLAEDWLLVPMLTGNEPAPLEWLWAQNNEHRIPLPKAILVALLRAAGGDFRAGMLFNIAIIGAAAAALVLVARRVRGHTRLADAFFPLLLLHLGHWENLFWGWQLTQILPTLLALVLLMTFVRQPELARPGAAWTAGLALLALPLCGANGLLFVPLPAAWMAYRGLAAIRGGEQRGSGIVLVASAAAAVAIGAVYFIGFERTTWSHPNPGIVPSMAVALQFLAFGLGPAVQRAWGPAAAFALGVMAIAAAVLIAAVARATGPERRRAIGVMLFAANVAAFVLAIGIGRAGALDVFGYWPLRYALMAAPAFCMAYYIAELYGAPRVRRMLPAVLCLTIVVLLPWNTIGGWVWRDWYGGEAAALDRQLTAGRSARDIAVRRGEFLIHWWDADRLESAMWMLHEAEMGPFARLRPGATTMPDDASEAERLALGARGRPLVDHRFEYRLPSAGAVWLAWGVNGWLPLVDSLRPNGTELRRRVMHTPMGRAGDAFVAELRVPAGDSVAFGFLTTERADRLAIRQLWDQRPEFTLIAHSDTTIAITGAVMLESEKSRKIWPWVLGMLAILALAAVRRRPGSLAMPGP